MTEKSFVDRLKKYFQRNPEHLEKNPSAVTEGEIKAEAPKEDVFTVETRGITKDRKPFTWIDIKKNDEIWTGVKLESRGRKRPPRANFYIKGEMIRCGSSEFQFYATNKAAAAYAAGDMEKYNKYCTKIKELNDKFIEKHKERQDVDTLSFHKESQYRYSEKSEVKIPENSDYKFEKDNLGNIYKDKKLYVGVVDIKFEKGGHLVGHYIHDIPIGKPCRYNDDKDIPGELEKKNELVNEARKALEAGDKGKFTACCEKAENWERTQAKERARAHVEKAKAAQAPTSPIEEVKQEQVGARSPTMAQIATLKQNVNG